jgi:predicted enzyme related to lactoylglutathione lyase
MLGFKINDLGPMLKAVEQLGAKIVTPPRPGSMRLLVEDPDGRAVELTEGATE